MGSYHEIRDIWLKNKKITDMRTAAFVNSINKVGVSYMELGIFP
jgi:glutamate dehydrogenase (NAD(P)+)